MRVTIKRPPQTQLGVNALRGERGPQGIQGPVGPKGDKGDTGDSGLPLIQAHIADTTPHPAYDDLPSLTLQFENGLI